MSFSNHICNYVVVSKPELQDGNNMKYVAELLTDE